MSSAMSVTVERSANPERYSDNFLAPVLRIMVWTFAVYIVISSFALPVSQYDDAIPLIHGMLVQQGKIPNLDFYSFYPPLNLYLVAATFSLLGKSVVAARLIAALLYIAVLLLATRLFRTQFEPSGPFIPAAVLLLAAGTATVITFPAWPGFALSLVALLVYLCSKGTGPYRLWSMVITGVLMAAALLCRINFGAYAVMVVAVDFFLQSWPLEELRQGRISFRPDFTAMFAFAVPLVLTSAGFCLWLYGKNIGVAFSEFVVSAQKLMAVRGFFKVQFAEGSVCALALPPAWFFFRMLKGAERIPLKALVPPVFIICILALVLVGGSHLSVAVSVVALEVAAVVLLHVFVYPLERSELCILLFYTGLLHYYMSRPDWSHWRVLPIVVALLLPLLVVPGYTPGERRNERSSTKGTALAFLAAAIFVFSAMDDVRPLPSYFANGLKLLANLVRHPHMSDTESVLGVSPLSPAWASVYHDEAELQTLRYLRSKTSSSTPIFVGVEDHSTIFTNDLRMYWLAGRPIGVRNFQLESRTATEPDIQQKIIADLGNNHVMWVLLDRELEGTDPEFEQGNYHGSRLLDDYIAQHYTEVARFGRYSVLLRQPSNSGTSPELN
jgi:hypothetical protein